MAIPKLKKRSDFLKASSLSYKTFSVVVQCNPVVGADLAFGFTASRRIGNAVVRNRAKRRLRSIAFELNKTKIVSSYHWVFIARSSCPNVTFISLKKDIILGINKCLEKISKTSIVDV